MKTLIRTVEVPETFETPQPTQATRGLQNESATAPETRIGAGESFELQEIAFAMSGEVGRS